MQIDVAWSSGYGPVDLHVMQVLALQSKVEWHGCSILDLCASFESFLQLHIALGKEPEGCFVDLHIAQYHFFCPLNIEQHLSGKRLACRTPPKVQHRPCIRVWVACPSAA
jgi:hypothetical protein